MKIAVSIQYDPKSLASLETAAREAELLYNHVEELKEKFDHETRI